MRVSVPGKAAQRDRLDGEEIAGKHARGLLAQELPPARTRAPRRRRKPGGKLFIRADSVAPPGFGAGLV
jgi:hypothetical protein